MRQTATNSDAKGFTLIELLIGLLILFISMTAILDFLVKYHRINLENTMRNESMRIAEAQLEQSRNTRFDTLTVGTTTSTTQRQVRNIVVNYTVSRTIQTISSNSVAVRVNVSWTYPSPGGTAHQHNASTIIATDV